MADFFSEFNAITTHEWQKSVEKVLKGQSIDTLNWQYDKSLNLAPLYTKSANEEQTVGFQYKKDNAWDIIITINQGDYNSSEAMNAVILEHLAGGATELLLEIENTDNLATILKDIWLDMIKLSWKVKNIHTAQALWQILPSIIGQKTINGHLYIDNADAKELLGFAQSYFNNKQMQYSLFTIKISSDNISLAESLAQGLENCMKWINLNKANNISLEKAVQTMQIDFLIHDAYFVEIAKIRAMKKLWLALLTYFNIETLLLPRLVAYTSSINNLDKNGELSLLAASSQALSAVIAGIDALCIKAPILWESIDNKTAERLARNVHHILLQESHLYAVVDPAAGAYYIEHATSELTELAWKLLSI